MNPSAVHCTTTVYGFGDNTAGQIWRNYSTPNSPLGGYENLTNYPTGESSVNSTAISTVGQFTLYWGLSKAVGSVCGYNLVNVIGFMTAALVMYGFIYWLTRSRWISLLAGYAVAFTPYYQVKIGGHPSYGYQAVFIGQLWLLMRLIRYRKTRDAVFLGMLAAFAFYFDPYFSLLSFSVITSALLAWAGYGLWKKQLTKRSITKKNIKPFAISLATLLVLLVPFLTIYFAQGASIKQYVGSIRGDVFLEAKACSNYPTDYLTPFIASPLGPKIVGPQYTELSKGIAEGFPCGIGEDSVGLSYVAIIVTFSGLLLIAWMRLQNQNNKLSRIMPISPTLAISVLLVMGLFAAWLALPPTRKFGVIPTGSYIMLHLTETWRTIARLYVLVNIALISLMSVSLLVMSTNLKVHQKSLKRAAYILIVFLLALEYQAFPVLNGNTFGTFDYSKDANAAYYWLRDNKDIKAIAEYPLERWGQESDIMTYYLTMQKIHNKPMLNSILPLSPQEIDRSGIKDITDPQTIPVLRSLGIDVLVIHGVSAKEIISKNIPGLEILYNKDDPINIANRLPSNSAAKDDRMVIVKLNGTPQIHSVPVGLKNNIANSALGRSSINWEYELLQDAQIIKLKDVVKNQYKAPDYNENKICFDIKLAATKDADTIEVLDNNGVIKTLQVTDQYQTVVLDTKAGDINLKGKLGHNMRVRNLGCE